jgi:hypothetical protein
MIKKKITQSTAAVCSKNESRRDFHCLLFTRLNIFLTFDKTKMPRNHPQQQFSYKILFPNNVIVKLSQRRQVQRIGWIAL